MITLLGGFPGNVVAVACSGLVVRRDYETVLIPAVRDALNAHAKIRLYYEIGPDFRSIEPAAMWEDFTIGMEHLSRWERVAVVTDVEWINLAIRTFSFLMPGKMRAFSVKEAAEARDWIAAA